ncbi:MAG: hypothetical protein J5680_03935 [Neisseriaceae bacterium]|nr:hypothetical protein [Neisseriaceae bacterium]
MGFQPTNNAIGVAFYLSGCLKTFCPLRWAGMPTLQRHLAVSRWVEDPPYGCIYFQAA